ncbi:hypothetical protein ABPG74_008929 [Tetrahymena malaccensis]
MKNLAIVLATLCIFAQATSVFETPAFLEIKSNPFGHTVASLVQLNLGAGQSAGRLDAIAEALNTIEAQLESTRDHNDAEIQRQRGWCSDQEATIQANIDQAESDLSNYQNEQAQRNQAVADLTQNLNNEQQSLAENQNNLANAQQELDDENSSYAESSKDYADAIAACEQALKLLATLQTNPSGFIQSKARFGNVVALLQKHLANKSSNFVQPILNVLTEMSTSTNEVDQSSLAKVVSLINDLLEELRNQSAANDQRHQQVVDSLNSNIANLEQLIANSNNLISQYQGQIQENEDRLGQLAGLITQTQAILDQANQNLSQVQDQCAGYDQEYASYKNEVDQQLATLQALKEYFKSKVVPAVENINDSAYQDELTVDV